MPNALPARKKIRLSNYNYGENGCYFLTICIQNKECILRRGEQCSPESNFQLTEFGIIVDNAINNIPKHYQNVKIDKYVIMPNHLHMILIIESEEHVQEIGRTLFAPTETFLTSTPKQKCHKTLPFSLAPHPWWFAGY